MKEEFQIKWESVQCHLCDASNPPQALRLYDEPLTQGQFGYEIHPVICKCGLVYLNPRWSPATYDAFYKKFYDAYYRLELKPDYGISGVIQNMRQVWERIRPNLNDKLKINSIIDIGCGSGHGLKYLKNQIPSSDIFGIEASPDCCQTLRQDIKATLVDNDVDGKWVDDYPNTFELIIMRHVVEHFLTPVATLKHIKKALAPDGFMYIAVPDMMHPRVVLRDYKNWWEYYFRAVHPYYYSKDTLFKTLLMAGLYPFAYGQENEEIWCLAGRHKNNILIEKNLYQKQIEVLNTYLPNQG